MENTSLSIEEIGKRGRELYQERIRPEVETEANIGKQIVIDIESGDYEIDEDGLTAGRRLQSRHPDALMHSERIGYNAVYALGGIPTRTKQ